MHQRWSHKYVSQLPSVDVSDMPAAKVRGFEYVVTGERQDADND